MAIGHVYETRVVSKMRKPKGAERAKCANVDENGVCVVWCGTHAHTHDTFKLCKRSKWASEKTAKRSENGIFEKQTPTTTTAAAATATVAVW